MTARRLVMLRALGLGDFLTAVPALRALAAAFQDHRRMLAAPAELRPLAELLGDTVHDVVDADFRNGFSRLRSRLRNADVAVNLHGCGPQSHQALLATQPRRLLAYRHTAVAASSGGPPWVAGDHEVDRWCRLLSAYGIAADPTDLRIDVPAGEGPGGATVLHPGAAAPARRWPVERWAAVARAEAGAGRPVLITGGPDEVDLARAVAARAGLPRLTVLAGQTDLAGLAAVVAVADRVVCGDTGVAHLATATGTPSVLLFGPTSPATWGPRIDRHLHRVVWKGEVGDPHASEPDRGLVDIRVSEVVAELARLPDVGRP